MWDKAGTLSDLGHFIIDHGQKLLVDVNGTNKITRTILVPSQGKKIKFGVHFTLNRNDN